MYHFIHVLRKSYQQCSPHAVCSVTNRRCKNYLFYSQKNSELQPKVHTINYYHYNARRRILNVSVFSPLIHWFIRN